MKVSAGAFNIYNKMEKIKKLLIQIRKSIDENHILINFILMLSIIFVTISSCIATANSTKATNSIRELQEQLEKERLKVEIKSRVALADNIISELKFNKFILDIITTQLDDKNFRNSTESIPGRIYKDRLNQAFNDPQFGNAEIRELSDAYSKGSDRFNEDLDEIQKAVISRDYKIKSERIGSAKEKLPISKEIVDNFLEIVDTYKKQQLYLLETIK